MDETAVIERLTRFAAIISEHSEPEGKRLQFVRENQSVLDHALELVANRNSTTDPKLFITAVKCVRILQQETRSSLEELFHSRAILISFIDVLLVPNYGGLQFDSELMRIVLNNHLQDPVDRRRFRDELKMHLSKTIIRFLIRADGPLKSIEPDDTLNYVAKACRLVSLFEATLDSDSNLNKNSTSFLLCGASFLMTFLSSGAKFDPATWVGDVELERFLLDKPVSETFVDVKLLLVKKMLCHHSLRNSIFLRDTLHDICSTDALCRFPPVCEISNADLPSLISFSFHIVDFLAEGSDEVSSMREYIRDLISSSDSACDAGMLTKLAVVWNLSSMGGGKRDLIATAPPFQDEKVLSPQFSCEERAAVCAIQEGILISSFENTPIPKKGFLLICFRTVTTQLDQTSTDEAITRTIAEWRSLREFFPKLLRDLPFSTTPSQLSAVLTDIHLARNASRESRHLQDLRNFSVMREYQELQNQTLYLVRAQLDSDTVD